MYAGVPNSWPAGQIWPQIYNNNNNNLALSVCTVYSRDNTHKDNTDYVNRDELLLVNKHPSCRPAKRLNANRTRRSKGSQCYVVRCHRFYGEISRSTLFLTVKLSITIGMEEAVTE